MTVKVIETMEQGYKRKTNNFMRTFNAYIKINYGDRCSTKEEHCVVCQMWEAYDKVADIVEE